MIERRFVSGAEVRAKDDGHIEGHAAVFNQEYVLYDGDSYRIVEKVKPGAFTRALKEKQDVRCLFNHDANQLLGRTKAGTMKLKQDDQGLYFDCAPPDTQLGRDVLTLVKRGDISGASFAFNVTAQTWREEKKDGVTVSTREIEDVDLFDASPVTYPAYTGTDVSARAEMRSQVLAIDGLPAEVRAAIERGKKKDTECSCRCVACARDGKCENCADHMVDCGDEKNCRCMDSRSAAQGRKKGGTVGGGKDCECSCPECQVGDCQNCSEPDCKDDDCQHDESGSDPDDVDSTDNDRAAALLDVDVRLRQSGLKPTA